MPIRPAIDVLVRDQRIYLDEMEAAGRSANIIAACRAVLAIVETAPSMLDVWEAELQLMDALLEAADDLPPAVQALFREFRESRQMIVDAVDGKVTP